MDSRDKLGFTTHRERLEADSNSPDTSRASRTPVSHSRSHSTTPEGLHLPDTTSTKSLDDNSSTISNPQIKWQSTRQNLQSEATTALSLMEISSQTNLNDSKDISPFGFGPSVLGKRLKAKASLSQLTNAKGSDIGDTASIRSYLPNPERAEEDSIFGDFTRPYFSYNLSFPYDWEEDFENEFEPIGELAADGQNEGL
jgi:vacuolar fusion protein MON1